MSPGVRLVVRLTPRGGRDAVDGWAIGADGRAYLKVRVSSPPVEGEANAALLAVLAKALKVSRSSISLAAGAAARLKTVVVDGVDEAAVEAAFGPRPGAS